MTFYQILAPMGVNGFSIDPIVDGTTATVDRLALLVFGL